MLLSSAPDPRDVVWENADVMKQTIDVKNGQFGLLLFTGTLFWFAVVGFVTSLSNIDQYKEKEVTIIIMNYTRQTNYNFILSVS